MTKTLERPPEPPKPRSLKSLRKEADELAAAATKRAGVCAAQGYRTADGLATRCSARLEWAHVKSRGVDFLRHDPRNAACLCSAHHKAFTRHPDHWYAFVRDRLPGTWDHLNDQIRERRETKRKMPLRLVCEGWIEHYREALGETLAEAILQAAKARRRKGRA